MIMQGFGRIGDPFESYNALKIVDYSIACINTCDVWEVGCINLSGWIQR